TELIAPVLVRPSLERVREASCVFERLGRDDLDTRFGDRSSLRVDERARDAAVGLNRDVLRRTPAVEHLGQAARVAPVLVWHRVARDASQAGGQNRTHVVLAGSE